MHYVRLMSYQYCWLVFGLWKLRSVEDYKQRWSAFTSNDASQCCSVSSCFTQNPQSSSPSCVSHFSIVFTWTSAFDAKVEWFGCRRHLQADPRSELFSSFPKWFDGGAGTAGSLPTPWRWYRMGSGSLVGRTLSSWASHCLYRYLGSWLFSFLCPLLYFIVSAGNGRW